MSLKGERGAVAAGASRMSTASTFSALLTAVISRSGDTGLTTKSKAPARIARTTVSMPPCAVCTITGMVMFALPQLLEHAAAVQAGHHQVEHDDGDVAAARPVDDLECRLAAIGGEDLVTGAADGCFDNSRRCTGSSSTIRMQSGIDPVKPRGLEKLGWINVTWGPK